MDNPSLEPPLRADGTGSISPQLRMFESSRQVNVDGSVASTSANRIINTINFNAGVNLNSLHGNPRAPSRRTARPQPYDAARSASRRNHIDIRNSAKGPQQRAARRVLQPVYSVLDSLGGSGPSGVMLTEFGRFEGHDDEGTEHFTTAEAYGFSMLRSGRGLACWQPEPLGIVEGVRGVTPGDVGVYSDEVGFEVIFNLWDDEESIRKTGEEVSSQTRYNTPQRRTRKRAEELRRGDVVAQGLTSRKILHQNSRSFSSFELNYSEPFQAGAALVATSPAELEQLNENATLQEHIINYAALLYRHANSIQRIPAKEALYIITGCVKSESWALASFTHPMSAPRDTLTLVNLGTKSNGRQVTASDDPEYYMWTETGTAEARTSSLRKAAASPLKDQSLFLRGFKLDFSDSFRSNFGLNSGAQSPGSQHGFDPGPDFRDPPGKSDYNPKGHGWQNPAFPGGGLGGSRGGCGSWGPTGRSQCFNSEEKPADSHTPGECSEGDGVYSSLVLPPSCHPCDLLNQWLFKKTRADFALCHDESWMPIFDDGLALHSEPTCEESLEDTVEESAWKALEDECFTVEKGVAVFLPPWVKGLNLDPPGQNDMGGETARLHHRSTNGSRNSKATATVDPVQTKVEAAAASESINQTQTNPLFNAVLDSGPIGNTFHDPVTAKMAGVGGSCEGAVKISEKDGLDEKELNVGTVSKACVLAWLAAPHFQEIYQSALTQRVKDTGTWFIQKPEFQVWVEDKGGILWINGIPGSGKTVLGSFVVHHLENLFQEHEDVGVAFAFLRYTEAQLTGADILAALLNQLIMARDKALAKVQSFCNSTPTTTETRPSVQILRNVLADITADFSKVYTIIDGFDEVGDAVKDELCQWLPLLGVNLIVFSRSLDLLRLDGAVKIPLRACAEDIDLYIMERIRLDQRLALLLDPRPDVEAKLREVIQSKSDGIFLVARLQMDEIVSSSNSIRGLFGALEKLPSSIEEMYRLTMSRIGRRTHGDVRVAHRVLGFLLLVAREDYPNHSRLTSLRRFPPSTEDIQHAIAANLKQRIVDLDCLTAVDLILSACCGLIVEVETSGTFHPGHRYKTLRFTHHTTRDYLESVVLTGWERIPSLFEVLNLAEIGMGKHADGTSTIGKGDAPVAPMREMVISETGDAAEPVRGGMDTEAQGVSTGGLARGLTQGEPQTHNAAVEPPTDRGIYRNRPRGPNESLSESAGDEVRIRTEWESHSKDAPLGPKGDVDVRAESKRGGGSKKASDPNTGKAPPKRKWFSTTRHPLPAKGVKGLSTASDIDPALLDARETDIVIPIMGAACSGKSSFINFLLEAIGSSRERVKVGDRLAPCTSDMESVVIEGQTTQGRTRLINLTDSHRLVIVDTPDFGNATESNFQTPRRVTQWFQESFRRKMILGGMIYLHDISLDRFSGTAQRYLEIFTHLCGEAAFDKVVLVTSKWGLRGDRNFDQRELELKNRYWKELLPKKPGAPGAHVMRLDPNKGEAKSAWDVVRYILVHLDKRLTQKTLEDVIQIQAELVKRKKPILEMEAAKELRGQLQVALRVQEEMLVMEASAAEGDEQAEAKLREGEDKLREMHKNIEANKALLFTSLADESFWKRWF